MNELDAEFEARFVPVPECGCWLWTGGRYSNGYGAMPLGRISENMPAHRFSYQRYKGEIPPGIFVCHKCDTKTCVNPDHLFLGTHTQNMRDMRKKGRAPIGERHGGAKLTEGQVLLIRKDPRALIPIAAEYGVSEASIHNIKHFKTWAHIKEAR